MVEALPGHALTAPRPAPRIGYSTWRGEITRPADRRRFCHWAARRGVAFEVARPGERYDLVVSNGAGDLSAWVRLPRPTRLVLDLVDSYLAVPGTDLRAMVRGLSKYVFGHTRHLHLDFRKLLEAACRRADAIVCTTEEQRATLLEYCPNVHVILDFQSAEVTRVKTDWSRGETCHVVWEGMHSSVPSLQVFAGAFGELRRRHPIALHLVTDLEMPLGSNDVSRRPTKALVRRMLGEEAVHLYEWNRHMMPVIATACDLAVVPIPLDDPLFRGKCENRLILFWRMGLPVVTSATPAFERAMRAAGLEEVCRTEADWVRAVERLIGDEAARAEAARRGSRFASTVHGDEQLLARWDRVFESLESPAG